MIYQDYASYRKAWDEAYEKDPPIPLNLDLELCSLCALRCPFCYWGDVKFQMEMTEDDSSSPMGKRAMPTLMAIRLIDEASSLGIPAIKFHGRGDGIHHKDYSKIILYARSKMNFKELLVNTHGMASPEKIDGLMAADKVMISLDSTAPERYEKMRVGGRLSNAIWTVHELLRRGHQNVWVRRVITQENKDEPFVENCKRIFGPKVHVSEHFAFPGRNDAFDDTVNPESWPRKYCSYPSTRLMVLANGDVVPCCVDWRAEMIVGNINKQSLIEIWNGEAIRKLRSELRANKFTSSICKNCTSFQSFDVRQRDFVSDIEGAAKI